MNPDPRVLRAALIAGVPFGLASALPFVSTINCCTCCGLIWGSALLASLLHSQECRGAGVLFDSSRGAYLGLLTGAINGATSAVVAMLINMLLLAGVTVTVPILEGLSDTWPDAGEYADFFGGAAAAGIWTIVSFFAALIVSVVIGALFGTLGGLIGGAVFRVDPTPPPSPIIEAPGTSSEPE